jgi:hypothetical protein
MKDVLEASEGALVGDLLGDRTKTTPITPKTVPWRGPLRAIMSIVASIVLASSMGAVEPPRGVGREHQNLCRYTVQGRRLPSGGAFQ